MANSTTTPLGLYIHVPFCARECEFCAFYKEKADRTKIDLYLDTIEEELSRFPPTRPVDTIFMGGGTPTLLTAGDLDRLCGKIREAAGNKFSEWTIECAPATLKKDKLEVLKKWGVNRFSLGVQSFNPKTLEAIGRPHSLKQIQEAIELLRETCGERRPTPQSPPTDREGDNGQGFAPYPPAAQARQSAVALAKEDATPSAEGARIRRVADGSTSAQVFNPGYDDRANDRMTWNIDLIFAAAESTLDDWLADLQKAIACGSQHLSTYCLTFESDTEMYVKLLRGRKKHATPEEEARFYKKTWELLRGAPMHHYEVSNFARPGCECLHNINTWRMGEWLGYGPSAASQIYVHPLTPSFKEGEVKGGAAPCDPQKKPMLAGQTGAQPPSIIFPRSGGGIKGGGSYCRYTNIADLDSWAAGVKSGQRHFVEETKLTPREIAVDAVIFGLRMPDGINLGNISKRFEELPTGVLDLGRRLQDEGYLVIDGEKWKLTEDGLLVADRIGAEIFETL